MARVALQAQKAPPDTELGLVVAGDETVAQLNEQYRGVTGTTDVLSFSLTEGEEEFVGPPGVELGLGDVIISYPQARRQAQELGHSVEDEFARLIMHGILHLLGYDHEAPADRARMRRRERALMEAWEKERKGR
ncbi:MAG: rRNA maturation RNase YbeY [Chloroflexi bacterium]|nr:rRNA maturation RNase YbeY [Chloroflexota bacterium]